MQEGHSKMDIGILILGTHVSCAQIQGEKSTNDRLKYQ